MLRFEDITLGDGAAGSCALCRPGSSTRPRPAEDVVADVSRAIAEWEDGPGPNLAFVGMEPLDHPGLPAILVAARERGAERMLLLTDCAPLAQRSTALAMLDAGVRHVEAVLVGSERARIQAMGVGSFAAAAAERDFSIHLSARVRVCRHNFRDLPATITTAAEMGVTAVHLVLDDATLDLREAAPWLEAACDTGVVNLVWVDVAGVPYGLARGWELHLASIYRDVAGTKSEACASCALDDVCGGAMPGASSRVLSALRPPADADALAECVMRGFRPRVSDCA